MNKSFEESHVETGVKTTPVQKGATPALLASRCRTCGATFFPKRVVCPSCFEQSVLDDINLDSQGTIYACTVVHVPSPAGIKAPYAYGYVNIFSDNIRVFALFTGGDPFSFHPGQAVELVLEMVKVDEQGRQVIGYKFKPASPR